ncbi:MAG: putative bifunctional diguanylate cyclase/phosphodiesterase [Geminicoccales bacterium]
MLRRNWLARKFKALTFGLGRRLSLAFGILLVAFVATAIVANLSVQLELIQQRLDARAKHLGKLLVDVTASHLYEMRLSDLEIIYEDLQRQPDIAYVYVLDTDQLELASGSIDIGDEPSFLQAVDDPLAGTVSETREALRNRDGGTEHIGMPVKLGTEYLGTVRFGIVLDEYNRDLSKVWVRNFLVGLFFVLFGMVLSAIVARRLTRPLGYLIAMTNRASHGDLDQSIDLHTNDELEHLASSFNTMLDALRKSIDEVHQLAYRDQLTSLPNRAWFHEYLRRTIADVKRNDRSAALLFLDLDRFKHVNDTLGHHAGDQLLTAFAERLQKCIRESDAIAVLRSLPPSECPNDEPSVAAVARLGGDEFTIVLPHLDKTEDAAIVAERIITSLVEPFDLDGEEFVASTSIGIAVFPADGDNPEDLLKHADAAMYQAKQAGRNTYRFYDARIAEIAIRRMSLERELHQAIEQRQFRVVFQPQFSVATGDVVGAEALIRWQHPKAGLLTPDRFLSVAEDARLMPEIGRLVFQDALRAAHGWPLLRDRRLRLAVNVSIEELEAEDFGEWILRELNETAFDAHALEIEVTESTAMLDNERVEAQVKMLRSAGIRFAVDDFGVGYSNLARMRRLAFETLKIDMSLMQGIGSDRDAEILVGSILSMTESLGLDVVAEGIETQEQLAFLAEHNCGYAQGYLLSRPMLDKAFQDWVRKHRVAETNLFAMPTA